MKVGIVSPYPGKDSTHVNSGGVNAYTKNLAQELAQKSEVTIFCDKINDYPSIYSDSRVQIIRCWRKGLSYPFHIWSKSLRSNMDIFHVQHEYFLYGGLLSAMIFPLLLLLLNIKAPVIVTLHGIISKENVNKLSGSNNNLPNLLKLLILRINLWQIILLSGKIIVHEKFIKKILINEYSINDSKILVIQHGIEKIVPLDEEIAKEKLNIPYHKVILFVGYLTERKGLEILMEAFEKIEKETRNTILIIGAGENPRLKDHKDYQMYYNRIKSKAQSIQNVRFVGFIPEDELKIYLSGSDIIVFPYSVAVAASGALHMALGFNKLVLCSDIIAFKNLISIQSLLFRTDDTEDLCVKLLNLLSLSQKDIESLKDTIRSLRDEYTWNNISLKTLEAYNKVLKKS